MGNLIFTYSCFQFGKARSILVYFSQNSYCMAKGYMRIITLGTLLDFWGQYPDSEKALRFWYNKIKSQRWDNSNQIKDSFSGADPVGNNRVVFNICKNSYRLIVQFRYDIQIAYVRFIGTHKEYDSIK